MEVAVTQASSSPEPTLSSPASAPWHQATLAWPVESVPLITEIVHPRKDPRLAAYAQDLYEARKRKGVMKAEAERLMVDHNYFASMAVHKGDADAFVTGATMNYTECVKPILEIIGSGHSKVASGLNMVLVKDRMLFFADTTVNIDPTAQQIANLAVHAAAVANTSA